MKMLAKSMYIAFGLQFLCALPVFAVDLNFKFNRGAVARYKTSTSVGQTLSRQGLFVPTKSQYSVDVVSTQTITDVLPDGSAVIENKIDSITAKVTANNKTFSYDSTSGRPAGALFGPNAALLNHPIYGKVTNKGKILEKTGWKAIYDEIHAQSPVKFQLNFNVNDIPGDALNAEMIQLPEGDMSPGAKWQRRDTVTNPLTGKTTLEANYTYEGNETVNNYNCAKISYTANIKPVYAPPLKHDDLETQTVMEIKGAGAFYLAIQEGVLVKSSKNLNVKTSDSLAFYYEGRPLSIFYTTSSDVTETMTLTSYTTGQQ
jgi:hypothetical protein